MLNRLGCTEAPIEDGTVDVSISNRIISLSMRKGESLLAKSIIKEDA